jgi:hypothetical protein
LIKTTPKQNSSSLSIKQVEFEQFTIAGYKWSRMFSVNKTLIHVDLSFNNLKSPDVQMMGEGLKVNHTILGIHLMGNEARVDELGFVTPEKIVDSAKY